MTGSRRDVVLFTVAYRLFALQNHCPPFGVSMRMSRMERRRSTLLKGRVLIQLVRRGAAGGYRAHGVVIDTMSTREQKLCLIAV